MQIINNNTAHSYQDTATRVETFFVCLQSPTRDQLFTLIIALSFLPMSVNFGWTGLVCPIVAFFMALQDSSHMDDGSFGSYASKA